MYGMTERQFRTMFDRAGKLQGKHGENFMILLESRLDNLVYRLGLARTRRQARQLVNHGHISVDGRRVDIPSYQCNSWTNNLQFVKNHVTSQSSKNQLKQLTSYLTYLLLMLTN